MDPPLSEPLVVDTNVVSFFLNRDPIRGPRYQAHTTGRTLYLPFVVVGELWFGAELRRWGPTRRERLERLLRDYVVIDSAPDIVRAWAALRVDAQRHGTPIERQDAWVAAVALALDLPLLTHNPAHFRTVPLLRLITEPDQ